MGPPDRATVREPLRYQSKSPDVQDAVKSPKATALAHSRTALAQRLRLLPRPRRRGGAPIPAAPRRAGPNPPAPRRLTRPG